MKRTTLSALVLIASLLAAIVFSSPAQAAPISTVDSTVGIAAVVGGASATLDQARTGKWIEVILSQQRLNAWQNGRIVMSSAISSGVSAHPTLRGTFRIYVKYRSTRMRGPGYNLPGVPYTMYYSGSYAIHGAYWHHNFGHPMSHGCINLPVPFSRSLFLWAPLGTTVVVH
ncbi:MAG TPA: L,D-transpeptidase [Anaerolineae bacterium]|jgi:lipoprotein-anchoring transpeptidase ErfK/SrfK